MSKKVKEKKPREPRQSLSRVLRNNIVIFGKVCKYAPELVILAFLEEGVLQGVHNSIYAVFTLHLFNSLDLGEPFSKIAIIIGLMSAWYLVFNILDRSWHRVIKPNLHHKLNQGIHTELFRKTREIDVACYDDPEFYNDFVWAMDEASSRAIKILEDLTRMTARLMALVTILGTLVAAKLDVAEGIKTYKQIDGDTILQTVIGDADAGDDGYVTIGEMLDDDIVKAPECPICKKKLTLLSKPLHSKGQRYTFHYGCERDGEMLLSLKLYRNFNETWRAKYTIDKATEAKLGDFKASLEKSVVVRRSKRKSQRHKRKTVVQTSAE